MSDGLTCMVERLDLVARLEAIARECELEKGGDGLDVVQPLALGLLEDVRTALGEEDAERKT